MNFSILGVNIAVTNLNDVAQSIGEWVLKKEKVYVCVAPVATIIDCQKDKKYKEIINKAAMTTPDGMPVVWLGRRKGHKQIARTYGPDLLPAVCEYGIKGGIKHFFYGGQGEVNDLMIQRLRKKFPEIKIAGQHIPDFLEVGELEDQKVIDKINEVDPDILWVGLGSPKQDYWMANHRDKLNVPVMVGVGAAFDFIAGIKIQAPKWMQKSGLEWVFRLCQEPKRLWRRYLIGNTLFIWLLIKSKFSTKC